MKVKGIVIHHSASPTWINGRQVDVNTIRQWHTTERQFRDIGYHYVILPSGLGQTGRPETDTGAHCQAGGRNQTHLGVCLVGDFSLQPPSVWQLLGAIMVVRLLMYRYRLEVAQVELHRQVPGAATACPGKLFPENAFYRLVSSSEEHLARELKLNFRV